MVSWDKTQGIKSQGSSERKEIQRISLQNGDNKIRLVGEVLPRYVYWLTTKEGKRMPVECLKFDRNTEQFSGTEDPFDEISADIYADKPQFAYVCNVIDRNDDQVKLFDLLLLQHSILYFCNLQVSNQQTLSSIHFQTQLNSMLYKFFYLVFQL